MRPVTATETAANAVRLWSEQYAHWDDDDRFADGTTKGQMSDALNRCAHTPEGIAKTINNSWAYPMCGCCGEYRNVVMEMGEHYLCLICIEAAAAALAQFPDAKATS